MLIEEIEKHTNNRVKVKPYWGQSLLKGKEILKGVKDGIASMGQVNINYYPNRLIVNGVFPLMQQGPVDFKNIHWVFSSCYEKIPELNAEFKKYNQKVLHIYSTLPYGVCFTKPVPTLDSFKGLRIRAASRWALVLLKDAGAIPVSIPWGDCYMALQTNAVEGVYTSYNNFHRTKLDEPAPYVFVFKELWTSTPYLININLDVWNKFPKDIQQQIEEAAKAASERFAVLYKSWFDKVVEEEQKSGCTITFAKPEEIQQWLSMPSVLEIQKTWIKEAKAAGANNAEDVLKQVKNIIAEGMAKEK